MAQEKRGQTRIQRVDIFLVSTHFPLLLESSCGRQECQKDKEPLLNFFLQFLNNGAFIVLVYKRVAGDACGWICTAKVHTVSFNTYDIIGYRGPTVRAKALAGVRVSSAYMACASVCARMHMLVCIRICVKMTPGVEGPTDLIPLWVLVVKDIEFSRSCVFSICLFAL